MIPKGTFVIEYVGEVISQQEKEERESRRENAYIMMYNKYEYIDGLKKGNPSRFINHSCEPNAEVHRYVILCNIMFDIFV